MEQKLDKLDRKGVIMLIYCIINSFLDIQVRISYNDAVIILHKMLSNDMSFLNLLKNINSATMDIFYSYSVLIRDNRPLINDTDIKVIDGLIKEIYSDEKVCAVMNGTSSYSSREHCHHLHIRQKALINMTLLYLIYGTNIKDKYSTLLDDINEYYKNYLNVIAGFADDGSADDELLNMLISDRKIAAQEILKKHKIFGIKKVDLRSCYESDIEAKTYILQK